MNYLGNMVLVQQLFPDMKIPAESSARNALKEARLGDLLAPGSKVAVTAGSRGIRNIAGIIKATADYILSCGCSPFIIASMGSHGGGTVSGQLAILGGLGITEKQMGCPVLASDKSLPITGENNQIFYVNSLAFDFDHIIIINRIKPHTSFHGPFESGLMKMAAVGLGGPAGASLIHSQGVEKLPGIIPRAGRAVLKELPVTLGVAILEDSFENTMLIKAVPPSLFEETEKELLAEARRLFPGIPFKDIDVLVVDEIGKNFSGTGMDTNVIGRLRIQGVPEPAGPSVKRVVALGLAAGSKGNGYGIGLADFTTQRLVESIDYRAMHLNAMTSTFIQRAMLPMTLPDDLAAINAAVKSLGNISPEEVRLVRIKNTLQLDRILVSRSLAGEAGQNKSLRILEDPFPITFAASGSIDSF
ncbi:MAG: hypothetical protein JL50_03330 [Peptococcaceae bacterium BICA1-7]|nr:MAG: hypothetical protein JL50_03330 [Peptococcaceae bacterium BICA1-7]HBV97703.1 hypothetical protein [Desulfotomaculum sp.]